MSQQKICSGSFLLEKWKNNSWNGTSQLWRHVVFSHPHKSTVWIRTTLNEDFIVHFYGAIEITKFVKFFLFWEVWWLRTNGFPYYWVTFYWPILLMAICDLIPLHSYLSEIGSMSWCTGVIKKHFGPERKPWNIFYVFFLLPPCKVEQLCLKMPSGKYIVWWMNWIFLEKYLRLPLSVLTVRWRSVFVQSLLRKWKALKGQQALLQSLIKESFI